MIKKEIEKPIYKVFRSEIDRLRKKIGIDQVIHFIALLSLPIYTKHTGYIAEISFEEGEVYCDNYIGGLESNFYIELHLDNSLKSLISGDTKIISLSEAKATFGRNTKNAYLYKQELFENTSSPLENDCYQPFPVIFSEFESWYELEKYSVAVSINDLLVIESDWDKFIKGLGEVRLPESVNKKKGLEQNTARKKTLRNIGIGLIPDIRKEHPSIHEKIELAYKIIEKFELMKSELDAQNLEIVTSETIKRYWLKDYNFD